MLKRNKTKNLFVLFLISAAAMDSNNAILPGMICLTSICLLYISCRAEMCKKKEPIAAGSIKNNLFNCIITQGKEWVNGKM